ncbi:hypothetical protein [Lacticaseibacillus paracasei]|uniref:hypothetical protein n=1 Tax=Lacticaseibacillus paracasei TaxID=1597 RepID=UPI000E09C3B8|nr:hypothetical protein [Lacticaseibacillus paracasei]RDG20730.1 hypothetical protein DQM17_12445 [Lacticaseibacillus paracasei]
MKGKTFKDAMNNFNIPQEVLDKQSRDVSNALKAMNAPTRSEILIKNQTAEIAKLREDLSNSKKESSRISRKVFWANFAISVLLALANIVSSHLDWFQNIWNTITKFVR